MTKNSFRIVAVPSQVAAEARDKAANGAPDHKSSVVEVAQSAPCRHCLTWAKPGERVILFPFQSIPAAQPYAESGPIFVHADPCAGYRSPNEFPRDLRNGRAVRAYNAQNEIVAAEVINGPPEDAVARLLGGAGVEFLQVRSASHGCYTFKVERA
jgi:hypothetical protein